MMKRETMGNKISALRREQGMTQAELAEKMSVTDKAVSKWERDLSCPDINSLPRLAEIFGISVDELMQVKKESEHTEKGKSTGEIITTVCKALALAMGVAVTVLSVMDKLEGNSAITMLGIGLAAAGIALFRGNNNSER